MTQPASSAALPADVAAGSSAAAGASAVAAKGSPVVSAEHVSKWYGQVIGLNDRLGHRADGVTGLLGAERRGQVHVHEADHRSAEAEQGNRQGARRADLAQPAPSISRSASVPSRTRSTSG
jgi:hypothetical protein